MSTITLNELLVNAQTDDAAGEALMTALQGMARRAARGDEDLAQDALLTLWKDRARYVSDARPAALWASTVMRHAVSLQRLRAKRREPVQADFDLDEACPDGGAPLESRLDGGKPLAVDVRMERQEMKAQVEALLSRLPEREAAILRARYGIGTGFPATIDEVARDIGVSRQRAHQLVTQAEARLRILGQEVMAA